jgi:hypothetical protein
MTDVNLDLSIATLSAACKGNVKLLPSFMVHDNAAWPRWQTTMLDSKNRIHMRRTTFVNVVATALPMRPGLWHGIDVQEYHIDLQPHHLQGSEDMADRDGYKHSRAVVLADEAGRIPGDDGYGETDPIAARWAGPSMADLADDPDSERRGIATTVLDPGRSE